MKKFLIVTFLLSFQLMQAKAQTAVDLLQKDLKQGISQFNRDTRLFSYFNIPKGSAGEVSDYFSMHNQRTSWLNFFISSASTSFWNLNYHNTAFSNAGAGIYFALDPSSSQEFGDTAIVIKVKSGGKILNVSNAIKLSSATLKALVSENIVDKSQLVSGKSTLSLSSGFSGTTLKNMVLSENENFRKAVHSIFKSEGIEIIQYLYKSYLAGFCKSSDQSAFVLVGSGEMKAVDNRLENKVTILDDQKNFFSKLSISNLTNQEIDFQDLILKEKNILDGVRKLGTGEALNLIKKNMTSQEYSETTSSSFKCEKRFNY